MGSAALASAGTSPGAKPATWRCQTRAGRRNEHRGLPLPLPPLSPSRAEEAKPFPRAPAPSAQAAAAALLPPPPSSSLPSRTPSPIRPRRGKPRHTHPRQRGGGSGNFSRLPPSHPLRFRRGCPSRESSRARRRCGDRRRGAAHAAAPRRGRKVSAPLREQLPGGTAAAAAGSRRHGGRPPGSLRPAAGTAPPAAAAEAPRPKVTARGSWGGGRAGGGERSLPVRLRGCGGGGEVWRQLLVKMSVWGSRGAGRGGGEAAGHGVGSGAPVCVCVWGGGGVPRRLTLCDRGSGGAGLPGLSEERALATRRAGTAPAPRGEVCVRARRAGERRREPAAGCLPLTGRARGSVSPPFPSAPAGRAPPRTWGRSARGFPVRGAVLA